MRGSSAYAFIRDTSKVEVVAGVAAGIDPVN